MWLGRDGMSIIVQKMKICSKCKVEKSKDEFYKDARKKDGARSQCKPCVNANSEKYRATPIGKISMKKWKKKYEATPKGKLVTQKSKKKYQTSPNGKKSMAKSGKRWRLKRVYGITIEQYDNMLKDQEYVCAICGTNDPKPLGGFCVDHDHITGEIRGLLCALCNSVLGYASDSVEILEKAVNYLMGRKEAKKIEQDGN